MCKDFLLLIRVDVNEDILCPHCHQGQNQGGNVEGWCPRYFDAMSREYTQPKQIMSEMRQS